MADNPHLLIPSIWQLGEGTGGDRLVVLIHGRGQAPAFMFETLRRIDTGPLDCVAIAAAGNSWYPEKFMLPVQVNQPRLDQSLARLDALLEEAAAKGFAGARLILIGFSQGACLACEFVYRHRKPLGGLIALTGGLVGPPEVEWQVRGPELAGTPVLMTNSDVDPWVPLSRTRQTADVFRAMGARVAEQVIPQRDHEVSDAEIAASREFLRSH